MSRSYKKNPFATDHHRKSSKISKRRANHQFRQKLMIIDGIPIHPQYKKYTNSYDICDYKSRMTKQDAIDWYNEQILMNSHWFKKSFPTLDSWLNYWEKCYTRK